MLTDGSTIHPKYNTHMEEIARRREYLLREDNGEKTYRCEMGSWAQTNFSKTGADRDMEDGAKMEREVNLTEQMRKRKKKRLEMEKGVATVIRTDRPLSHKTH